NELVEAGEEVHRGVLIRRFPYWRKPLPALKRVMQAARRAHLPLLDYLEPATLGPFSPEMFLATRRAEVDVIACMAFPFLHMYYPPSRVPVVLFGALHVRDDHVSRPVLRAIDKASAYIAFTRFEQETLVRHGAAADRIHVVGLGVDVDRFAHANGKAIRTRLGIGDEPVVGFVGRQARHKGCDTLVRAMATVWESWPEAYLLFAGSRTDFSVELDALIAALPAERRQRVIVQPDFPEDEKADWFAACDVFSCVSTDESFGIVFVEAWACGKPVIGGRIGSVECVIRDGVDGLLVPTGNADELSRAISSLLDDRARAAQMGANGYHKVRTEHDWPAVVAKVHAIYEQVA
ncbi:MAG TPA: glycosyltransferase family 4 protein, partial [Kofleriaceae bacterium]